MGGRAADSFGLYLLFGHGAARERYVWLEWNDGSRAGDFGDQSRWHCQGKKTMMGTKLWWNILY